jgi:GDP-D-mannose 3', 5'-epimerase
MLSTSPNMSKSHNVLINVHTLEAAHTNGVKRYLYTPSACVYPEYRQMEADVAPLKEEDAYPAQPQDAYGWEKLITERLCLHYHEDYGIDTRIVRFHNIFGPLGTWKGGREKALAALCRKVAIAKPEFAVARYIDPQVKQNQQDTRGLLDACIYGKRGAYT